jgi:hypothetical protein
VYGQLLLDLQFAGYDVGPADESVCWRRRLRLP